MCLNGKWHVLSPHRLERTIQLSQHPSTGTHLHDCSYTCMQPHSHDNPPGACPASDGPAPSSAASPPICSAMLASTCCCPCAARSDPSDSATASWGPAFTPLTATGADGGCVLSAAAVLVFLLRPFLLAAAGLGGASVASGSASQCRLYQTACLLLDNMGYMHHRSTMWAACIMD